MQTNFSMNGPSARDILSISDRARSPMPQPPSFPHRTQSSLQGQVLPLPHRALPNPEYSYQTTFAPLPVMASNRGYTQTNRLTEENATLRSQVSKLSGLLKAERDAARNLAMRNQQLEGRRSIYSEYGGVPSLSDVSSKRTSHTHMTNMQLNSATALDRLRVSSGYLLEENVKLAEENENLRRSIEKLEMEAEGEKALNQKISTLAWENSRLRELLEDQQRENRSLRSIPDYSVAQRESETNRNTDMLAAEVERLRNELSKQIKNQNHILEEYNRLKIDSHQRKSEIKGLEDLTRDLSDRCSVLSRVNMNLQDDLKRSNRSILKTESSKAISNFDFSHPDIELSNLAKGSNPIAALGELHPSKAQSRSNLISEYKQ